MLRRTPRAAVIALFALNGGLFGLWAARIPAFVERFDLTPDRLGLLLLCVAFGALPSFPVAGRLSDRLGSARLSRILVPGYAAAFLMLPLVPTVWAFGLALFVLGAFYGALDVSMNAYGAEVEAASGRPIMASFHAMYSLGAMLGGGAGFAAVALGLAPVVQFWAIAVPAAILTWWMAGVPWTSAPARDDAPIVALPKGPLILVGLLALASGMSEGTAYDWSAVFLVEAKGLGEGIAALGFAAFNGAMVVMRLLGDRIVTRFGPVPVTRWSGLAVALGIVLILVLPEAVALAGFAVMGVGCALVVPLCFSRAAADPFLAPGQAIAAVSTLGYGAILITPAMVGGIAGALSLEAAFAVIGIVALMITAFASSLRRPA